MNCCDCVTKERWPSLQGRPRKQLLQLRLYRRRLQWPSSTARPGGCANGARAGARDSFYETPWTLEKSHRNFDSISLFASR